MGRSFSRPLTARRRTVLQLEGFSHCSYDSSARGLPRVSEVRALQPPLGGVLADGGGASNVANCALRGASYSSGAGTRGMSVAMSRMVPRSFLSERRFR